MQARLFSSLMKVLQGIRTTSWGRSDRHAASAVFLVLIVFYGVFAYTQYAGASGLRDNDGLLIGRDFVVFWSASVLLLDGQMSQIFDLASFHAVQERLIGSEVPLYPWLYPPHGLFPILPLGLLPYLWSYLFWSASTLVLYLWAAVGRPWKDPRTLALVLAPATFVNFLMGQNGFLTAALLIGGLRLLDHRPVLAGILIGLLCFKPQLGLLIPVALVAARLWRPFLSASVTVAAMLALSLAMFGPESWISFFETSTVYQARALSDDRGWLLNIVTSPFMSMGRLGFGMTARIAVQAIFTVAMVLAVYVTFRTSGRRDLQIAVLLVAVPLASPYAYHYDLTLLSVAVLWAFERATGSGFLTGEKAVLALAWLLPLLVVIGNIRGIPVGPPALAALFCILLVRANGWLPRQAPAPPARDAGVAALPRPSERRT
jgi:hypothetical protein